MATLLRAYWFPLILFACSMFFQLIVLPRSYPPSHYDVLGIKRHSSVEDVTKAYERLSSKWTAGIEVPTIDDFVKIRCAFELLTNPLWKRDYDIYGVDEHIHVIAKVQEEYSKTVFSEIDLPLLEPAAFDPKDQDFNLINSRNFRTKFENSKALLLQVFSSGSNRCAKFAESWKRIAALLDGVATTGMVELGEIQLAEYLAGKTFTGQPSFQNGLPSLVVFPAGCNTSSCLVRYEGELSVDAVTDWFATTILSLPRILYYSKESLAQRFLAKASPHKVKVIFFSESGERATPFVRKAAQDYWPYTVFAYVLWREQDSSIWWNTFGVESAPAVVLLKESGVKPVVYHGPANESWFVNIMEQNKHHELPQLRSVTSMELGCDARGYSRAGNETAIWYCVILTGRQSQELGKMRETMRRVHQELSIADNLDTIGEKQVSPPAVALKEKRLTFTWLDGESQQRYCFFLVQSPTSYDTCGTRRDTVDIPQLVIVRFKRNATEDSVVVEKKPRNIFEALKDNDVDPASQLVARYNGSEDTSEIIKWISQIIEDGDSKDLPFFRAKAPELVPEDADPIWSKGVRSVVSKGSGIKQKISSVVIGTHNRLEDPRIGPVLLLGALMSFGNIWLRRNRTQPNAESQPSGRDEGMQNRRRKSRNVLNQDLPPSLTDMEPKDAVQMPLSDSD